MEVRSAKAMQQAVLSINKLTTAIMAASSSGHMTCRVISHIPQVWPSSAGNASGQHFGIRLLHSASSLPPLDNASSVHVFPTRREGFVGLGLHGLPRWSQGWACCSGSVRGMAGHSKWANIRHIKASKDNERSRVISDFCKRVRAFVRETGQVDPKTSTALAKMITDAKSKNVPGANIDRVLAQMASLKNASPMVFEAKGPGGSVMVIEAVTSRRTHTRSELQNLVKKCGFSMFDGGSLARMVFEQKGMVLVPCEGETAPDLDSYIDVAIEAGAEDVTVEEDEDEGNILQFVCEPDQVYVVKRELESRSLNVQSADVVYLATSTVPVDDSTAQAVAKVLDRLDEHPDVLKVYTNLAQQTS